MEIAIIDGATRTIGASQGYIGLPLRDVILDEAVNGPSTSAMQSAWSPSQAELASLIAGGKVILTVLGRQHPPVLMAVEERAGRHASSAPKGTHAKILDLGRELENAKVIYLERFGWSQTCHTPGSYWMWTRDFADYDAYLEQSHPATASPFKPYGRVMAGIDTAVEMTRKTIGWLEAERDDQVAEQS